MQHFVKNINYFKICLYWFQFNTIKEKKKRIDWLFFRDVGIVEVADILIDDSAGSFQGIVRMVCSLISFF